MLQTASEASAAVLNEISDWLAARERGHYASQFYTHETESRASECGFFQAAIGGLYTAIENTRHPVNALEADAARLYVLDDVTAFVLGRWQDYRMRIDAGTASTGHWARYAEASNILSVLAGRRAVCAETAGVAQDGLPQELRLLLFRDIPAGKDWRATWDGFLSFGRMDKALSSLLDALDSETEHRVGKPASDSDGNARADLDGRRWVAWNVPELSIWGAASREAGSALILAILNRWGELRALRRIIQDGTPAVVPSPR